MQDIVSILIDNNRPVDLYILARFTYRFGEPILTDEAYEILDRAIKTTEYAYLSEKSYDDDDIPYDLIKEFNLSHLIFSGVDNPKLNEHLADDKSLSIKSLNDYKDIYDYFMATPDEDKVLSLKINGINNKVLYENSQEGHVFVGGLTRGRSTATSLNVSKNLSKVVPLKVENLDKPFITIFGETTVINSVYKTICRDNAEGFTSARMAAISMLRVDYPEEEYKNLRFMAFNSDGLSDTLWGTFDKLESLGFNVPPRRYVKATDVPKDYEEFRKFLFELLSWFREQEKSIGIDADGVVADVNDKNFVGEITNQYSNRNCAIKVEWWYSRHYTGIVKDIIIEQQRVNASVVIEIEPITTDDNVTARRVTTYNPSYVIDNDITVGSEIKFGRNSEAVNVLVTDRDMNDSFSYRYSNSFQ